MRHESAEWREQHTPARALPFRSWIVEVGDDERRATMICNQQAKDEAHQIYVRSGRRVHWTTIRDGLPTTPKEEPSELTVEWDSPAW